MLRLVLVAAALSLGAAASAQTPPPAALQVQLLAPQLLAFSGSNANFESLVNGLTQGTPVTLTTLGAGGQMQIVTFLPGTTLSPTDAARSMETARQGLISRGIASPTAQQLAVALMGGALPTPAGSTAVTGVVSGNAGTTPIQLRNELATPAGNPPALLGFTPPGGPMSGFELNQALRLASVLLAQQGILDPTPEQLRIALLGGNLGTGAGSVAIQGVLQGQVRNTSDSPLVRNTSNSPLFGTSDTPILGTSNTPPTTTTPAGVVVPRLNGGATRAPARVRAVGR